MNNFNPENIQATLTPHNGLHQDLISVIIPVFNEEDVVQTCHYRLSAVLNTLAINAEIIFINDGSTNKKTRFILETIRELDPRVFIIELSRNFGKEAAMSAGLDHANGDAVIIMDADLQAPPELIPEMLCEWQKGYETVYMKRRSRKGETALKKLTAYLYYRLLNRLSPIHIPADVGDFRLLSRVAVDALKQLPERNRYMKGLFSWIGFSQKEILYDRDPRLAGNTQCNYRSLLKLSLDGLTSFSTTPLKLATYMGFIAAGGAFLYGFWIVTKTLFFGEAVQGYPSMMVIILFLGGVQLISIGILGEYLGRMFMESKQRPLYLLKKTIRRNINGRREPKKRRDILFMRIKVYQWIQSFPFKSALVIGLLVRLVSLGAYPLMDTTEARYGEMGRKMLETGNWLTPQFDYVFSRFAQNTIWRPGQRNCAV